MLTASSQKRSVALIERPRRHKIHPLVKFAIRGIAAIDILSRLITTLGVAATILAASWRRYDLLPLCLFTTASFGWLGLVTGRIRRQIREQTSNKSK